MIKRSLLTYDLVILSCFTYYISNMSYLYWEEFISLILPLCVGVLAVILYCMLRAVNHVILIIITA